MGRPQPMRANSIGISGCRDARADYSSSQMPRCLICAGAPASVGNRNNSSIRARSGCRRPETAAIVANWMRNCARVPAGTTIGRLGGGSSSVVPAFQDPEGQRQVRRPGIDQVEHEGRVTRQLAVDSMATYRIGKPFSRPPHPGSSPQGMIRGPASPRLRHPLDRDRRVLRADQRLARRHPQTPSAAGSFCSCAT